MRVLHTADLHLRPGAERTLEALDALLATAREREVDLLTVGGDLFDSPEAADELRPALRERFADNPFDVVAVPGNHDAGAFERNVEFGPDFEPLVADPYERRRGDDCDLVGLPYTDELDEERFRALREAGDPDRTRVLLAHCTLDVGFAPADTGDERATRYCPVQKATLADMGYDFVLAGHVHADLYQTKLANGGLFVYPGSPVSHTWHEQGQRHAVLLDTATDDIRPLGLPTYYRDRFTATVAPGETEDLLERVAAWTDSRAGDDCDLEVRVDGLTDLDERTFDERLREAAAPVSPTNETRSASAVYDHPVYRRFAERVDDLDLSEFDRVDDREQVERRVVASLAALLDASEVSGG